MPWLGGVVRTSLDPASLSGEIRRTVAALDPMLAVYEVRTMVAAVEESYWVRRAYSTLLTAFAVTALVLALSGVYGVVAHTAARRTREPRDSRGAQRADVVSTVLGRGLIAVGVGVTIGLGVIAVAVVASGIPARRAASIEPIQALRVE